MENWVIDESKKKVSKYLKCQKDIPKEKRIFCSYHRKSVKEKSETVGKGTIRVAVLLAIINKKKERDVQ